jgi:hypothetical protein
MRQTLPTTVRQAGRHLHADEASEMSFMVIECTPGSNADHFD